ncbi:MAG: DUF3427 domain-containing protein [Actinomycetales bacterium]
MEEGLHETLLTERILRRLTTTERLDEQVRAVDDADQPHVLARHIAELVERAVRSHQDPARRLRLVNDIVSVLDEPDDTVSSPPRQLLRLAPPAGPGVRRYPDVRPSTPLSESALLTNSKAEPSLGAELRAEIDTADEVDLLCAFVRWPGLRLLEPQLARLRENRVPFRVITTTYLGATQARALDRLVRDFGAQVRVQYDIERTRLHAKAWIFQRNTGFHTAYVGSSNLSRAALLDGVEWNVRLSHVTTPALLAKSRATFDSYWNDESFEPYDPDRDRDRLDDALAEAAGGSGVDRRVISLAGLDVRPYPHQQTMLDALATERLAHDRHRNLLVAATGTGKTVVAAMDYRELCDPQAGTRPTLLFVAHRQEILTQALRTYREVLRDNTFAELYVGGRRPERWRQVFASVQSLTAYGVQDIPAEHFEVVVIDEFHHAEAATYRRLLDHLRPRELLGLTATPERADGLDVRGYFDGRTAAELRLWDALGADLLCPFHYFAIADNTDLSSLTWRRGRYDDAELSTLYTGNHARARLVLKAVTDKVIDPLAMRALGFCVGVDHAEFMATVFTEAGIPALAVTGRTSPTARRQAVADLEARRVNVLFTADLFNEGFDLPAIDTVLFLRPTESATIFVQQLGRGLRRTRDKAVLTALDFVGHQHREFRFDQRLRALTGLTRNGLISAAEHGFPFLPAGCQIVLEEQAQEAVLSTLRTHLTRRWPELVRTARDYAEEDLATFLSESHVRLADILRQGQRSWTQLRRDAGLATRPPGPREAELLRRVRAFAHVDDPHRAAGYQRLLDDRTPAFADLDEGDQRLARMLVTSCWPDHAGFVDPAAEGLAALRAEPAVREELRQVVGLSFDQSRHLTIALTGQLARLGLRVHASYSREEALEALDFPRAPSTMREGVAYIQAHNIDALFITLKKSEADYSPTTLYRDYPVSPTVFHWESQSRTTLASPTARRYLTGSSRVLLFARLEQRGEFGTSPYLFLGPAQYQRHEGERPIAIWWRLEHSLPMEFFLAARAVAA